MTTMINKKKPGFSKKQMLVAVFAVALVIGGLGSGVSEASFSAIRSFFFGADETQQMQMEQEQMQQQEQMQRQQEQTQQQTQQQMQQQMQQEEQIRQQQEQMEQEQMQRQQQEQIRQQQQQLEQMQQQMEQQVHETNPYEHPGQDAVINESYFGINEGMGIAQPPQPAAPPMMY